MDEESVGGHGWEHVSSDSDDSLVISMQFNQGENNRDDDIDFLIDTGSTCSVMKSKDMLVNVKKSKKTLRAYTNGGHQNLNEEGDLPGF